MLRPKAADAIIMDEKKMSVTLINTQTLPTYSSERFYLLSELELHAHSTTFLCDVVADCDQTQDTAESSEASLDCHGIQPPQIHPQQSLTCSYNILYILWRPDQASSPRAFAEGTIAAAIQQWKTLDISSSNTHTTTTSTEQDVSPRTKLLREPKVHLYLVVDIPASPQDDTATVDRDTRLRQFQVQTDTAERLARHVAQSKDFRQLVDGITVGISNHVRAAPGLEACVDAVSVGSTLRRRRTRNSKGDAAKSNIGLVALNPDDLLGLQDENVTDAAQGVLQSRTCAEWNGHGNLLTFAKRAHSAWCMAHGVDEEDSTLQNKSTKSRKRRQRGRLEQDMDMDPLMTCLVVFFFGYVLSHLWVTYYAER
jgi:hypothetical protein